MARTAMFSTISRKLFRPDNCTTINVTNCDQRKAVRNERPSWCIFASDSNSCLKTNLSSCKSIVLLWAMAWFPFLLSISCVDIIVSTQKGFQVFYLLLNGTAVKTFFHSMCPQGTKLKTNRKSSVGYMPFVIPTQVTHDEISGHRSRRIYWFLYHQASLWDGAWSHWHR